MEETDSINPSPQKAQEDISNITLLDAISDALGKVSLAETSTSTTNTSTTSSNGISSSSNSTETAEVIVDKAGAKDEQSTPTSSTSAATTKSHVPSSENKQVPQALLDLASWIQDGAVRNFLVVTGAGISVSAGIPDFRTPHTGLYDNLQKYNLPYPEAVFDLDYFGNVDPQPFVTLAKELWPTGETFRPTITHSFLTLLARKNLLLRVYSQNIDGLEQMAGIPVEKLVECHGHFRSASCIRCGKQAPDIEVIKATITRMGKVPKCQYCKIGYVKPDIVFFGEGLPHLFHNTLPGDLRRADCCLVLGTSLLVAPVSQIPEQVRPGCKRFLINRELVGSFQSNSSKHYLRKRRHHDSYHLGDCDDTIRSLAKLLGWLEELEDLHSHVSRPETSEQTE